MIENHPSHLKVGSCTAALLILSPVAALPITFLLMLAVGESSFGAPSDVTAGWLQHFGLALKYSGAMIFITLIYIGEHALFVIPPFIVASIAVVRFVLGTSRKRHGIAVAVLVFGVMYPAVFVIGEIIDWDKSLFN